MLYFPVIFSSLFFTRKKGGRGLPILVRKALPLIVMLKIQTIHISQTVSVSVCFRVGGGQIVINKCLGNIVLEIWGKTHDQIYKLKIWVHTWPKITLCNFVWWKINAGQVRATNWVGWRVRNRKLQLRHCQCRHSK